MNTSSEGFICPFCFGRIDPAVAFNCPSCTTPHHLACFQLEGGCAVSGCGARLELEHSQTPAPPRPPSSGNSFDQPGIPQQSPYGSPPGPAVPPRTQRPPTSTGSPEPDLSSPAQVRLWAVLAVGVLSIIAVAFVVGGGNGSSSGTNPQPSVGVTATGTQPAADAPSTRDPSTRTPEQGTEPEDPAANDSSSIGVPNGIGMNYQDAQDLWRSSGLVVMPATDATGANRIPIIDSGWVVLDQDPAPGASVPDGSEITATVKKFTDD